MKFKLENIIRKNIASLTPYSSARSEFKGKAKIWLDANENPYNNGQNRYPDPLQMRLKQRISEIKGVETSRIFLGNGSDEPIDLLIRACCEPNRDSILTMPPTYGMYQVSADINAANIVKIPLEEDFSMNKEGVLAAMKPNVKIIFICSPNNPTGNSQSLEDIRMICKAFHGLVVVDEAYIDFSRANSALELLSELPNLVILQTLSKAYGMAGIRLGMAFADERIINLLNSIKPPYNVNILSQEYALEKLGNTSKVQAQITEIQLERQRLKERLSKMDIVEKIYPSDANFMLVRFNDAKSIYRQLAVKGIVLRDRTSAVPGTLRITIGTPKENNELLQELNNILIANPRLESKDNI
jgi:histidinol-phosphate aminotransferase